MSNVQTLWKRNRGIPHHDKGVDARQAVMCGDYSVVAFPPFTKAQVPVLYHAVAPHQVANVQSHAANWVAIAVLGDQVPGPLWRSSGELPSLIRVIFVVDEESRLGVTLNQTPGNVFPE